MSKRPQDYQSIRDIGRKPLEDIILASSDGVSGVYGSYKEDVRKNQLPLIVRAADGSGSRRYEEGILGEIAADKANCAPLRVYTNAGLALSDLRCQTIYSPEINNIGQLIEKLKSSKSSKTINGHTLTIFLSPEQMATLERHYNPPAVPIEHKSPQQIAAEIKATPLGAAGGAPTFGDYLASLTSPEKTLNLDKRTRFADFLATLTQIETAGNLELHKLAFITGLNTLRLAAETAGDYKDTIHTVVAPKLVQLAEMFGVTLQPTKRGSGRTGDNSVQTR